MGNRCPVRAPAHRATRSGLDLGTLTPIVAQRRPTYRKTIGQVGLFDEECHDVLLIGDNERQVVQPGKDLCLADKIVEGDRPCIVGTGPLQTVFRAVQI